LFDINKLGTHFILSSANVKEYWHCTFVIVETVRNIQYVISS